MSDHDLVHQIAIFISDKMIVSDEVAAPHIIMALVECAGMVLGTTMPGAATAKGNHMFNLLCDHLAAAIAHYAAGGTTNHDDWLDGENDDETRFKDPRSLRHDA